MSEVELPVGTSALGIGRWLVERTLAALLSARESEAAGLLVTEGGMSEIRGV
jgi:hypothetical protein